MVIRHSITSMALARSPCLGFPTAHVSAQPALDLPAMTFLFTTSKRGPHPKPCLVLGPSIERCPCDARCMHDFVLTSLEGAFLHAVRTTGGLPWPLNIYHLPFTLYYWPSTIHHPTCNITTLYGGKTGNVVNIITCINIMVTSDNWYQWQVVSGKW